MQISDRELLRAFRAERSTERFHPFVDRYLPFVYSAAYRQLGNEAEAALATRAVFFALARRLRGLSRKTVLVRWLFDAARLAARKLKPRRTPKTASPVVPSTSGLNGEEETWVRLSPLVDQALGRLSPRYRNPVLLHCVLGWDLERSAQALRVKSRRVQKRTDTGLRKLSSRFRKKKLLIDPQALRGALAARGCAVAPPEDLGSEITRTAQECFRRRPKMALARRVLRGVTWARWQRRLKRALVLGGSGALLLGVAVVSVILLWRSGWLLPRLIEVMNRWEAHRIPEMAKPAQPWPPEQATFPMAPPPPAAADLYRTTNIWLAHLKFTTEQWAALQPKHVPAIPEIMRSDGTVVLRNPKAARSGVAGVLGFDFGWAHADLEVSGLGLTNVAARFRGNGTYVSSLWGAKQPLKAALDKFERQQEFAGIHTLNFLNMVSDRSYLSDALGYELFRDAGVPAPRTAYAWLTLSVSGQFDRKPIGLYLLAENLDADFALARFGSRKVPIFKPVTQDLFKDLGNDWAAYADIYDLKTKASPAQKQRLIDFARFVTHANDAEFARRVGEFLDLDEFARFLAALVLVANYDSLLTYGQNYYLYLDPNTERFGFIPWDLDQAWGSFPQFGTSVARERASIWQPWVFRNRFLERVTGVEEFRGLYRRHLESLLATAFRPERLDARIDEIARVIRGATAAESTYRVHQFDQAISANWLAGPRDGGQAYDRPVHQIKRFIAARAKSVRAQLDGRSKGIVLWQNSDSGN